MKKAHILFVAVLLLAFGAAILWYRGRQPATGGPDGGKSPTAMESGGRTAPPFSLNDIDGNNVSSSRFAGKPTVINFFATWCPPCRQEIPGFVEIYDKYRGSGFELVGISLDTDTKGNLAHFIAENRIGYRILLGSPETARAYGGVNSIPTTFFVGKDGRIRNVHVGYMDRDTFESEVKKLL